MNILAHAHSEGHSTEIDDYHHAHITEQRFIAIKLDRSHDSEHNWQRGFKIMPLSGGRCPASKYTRYSSFLCTRLMDEPPSSDHTRLFCQFLEIQTMTYP